MLAIGGGICGVILAVWTNELLERRCRRSRRRFRASVGSLARLARHRVRHDRLDGGHRALRLCCRRGARRRPAASWPSRARSAAERRAGGRWGWSRKSSCRWSCCSSPAAFCRRSSGCRPRIPDSRGRAALCLHLLPVAATHTRGRPRALRAGAERLRALPGVRSAALTSSLPLMPSGSTASSRPAGPQIPSTTSAVDTGYFDTMGIGIVAGRDFADRRSLERRGDSHRQREPRPPPLAGRAAIGERVMIGCRRAQAGGRRRRRARFGDPRRGRAGAQPHLYRPFDAAVHGGPHGHPAAHRAPIQPRMVQPFAARCLGWGKGSASTPCSRSARTSSSRYATSDGWRRC